MTIKENLQHLLQLVQNEPENLFDLRHYTYTTPCGTLHCTLGLAATDPVFQGMGLSHNKHGGVDFNDLPHTSENLENVFGPDPWHRLFETRGDGHWDGVLLTPMTTDKELAIARIQRQIKEIDHANNS